MDCRLPVADCPVFQHYHYIHGPDGPVALAVKVGNETPVIYYLCSDHLNSITGIMNSSGTLLEEYNYGPWGRRRDPATWSRDNAEIPDFEIRGFTGHEHLDDFNIIHMNGRLFDPENARLLNPDPVIQDLYNLQNFNRYSYCLNNPLKYTDPDGEFFFGTIFTFIRDFFRTTLFHGGLSFNKNVRKEAWKNFDPSASWSATNKAWKIDIGGFKTDPHRTIVGRGLQFLSRWTRELPQTLAGKLFSHTRNVFGGVDNVGYYGGATLVNKNDNSGWRWGLTLGSYINSKNVIADPYRDALFRHEYGHTLQSRLVGPLYLTHVGLPSLIGSGLDIIGWNDHDREWYEAQANHMSERYFSNHDPGALNALPWDDSKYPREYNPNWYWIFAHPPLPFMWWLFF